MRPTPAAPARPGNRGDGRPGDGAPSGFYRSPLPRARWHHDRDAVLVELARDEHVVHVGCTDSPLTEEKLADGTLLHPRLAAVADDLVGVDLDGEGLELLRARVGGRYARVDATDEAALAAAVADARPTVVMAADVIEHVADAGRFVGALATCVRAGAPGCRLVVSTPNGLSLRGPVLAWAGTELIHPDHRVVHTPASLSRTLADAGFRPLRWATYPVSLGAGPARWAFDAVSRTVGRVRPLLADGLVVVADLAGRPPEPTTGPDPLTTVDTHQRGT